MRSVAEVSARELFAPLGPTYDRYARLLSFGQDPRWRRFMVSRLPASAARLLDVATGTAAVAIELARAVPGRIVVGIDQSPEMLAAGRARVARAALADRIELREGRAESLPFADDEFDALTFTYLLRYVDDPGATMRELARVVKPEGRIGMVEFGVPKSAPLRAAWRVYTRAGLPIIGRAVSPAWFEVGRFLGPNIEQFHSNQPDLATLWRQSGIGDIEQRNLSFGAGLVMWGVRAPRNGRGERPA